MVAARLYSIDDVGVGTAIMASISLIGLLAMLGLDYSLIRFMPSRDRSVVFGTCLTATTIAALIFGLIYVQGMHFFSPDLQFLEQPLYLGFFVLFAITDAVSLITGNAFISMRRSDHYFIQNILLGLRALFLFPLVILPHLGINTALGLSFIITTIYSIYRLRRFLSLRVRIDWGFIKDSFRFSSRNYIASLLYESPTYLLPIMILSVRGSSEVALFFVAFTLGNMVLMIPIAFGTSLFVEGSHGEALKKNLFRAAATVFGILVPAVASFWLLGGFLLRLFGANYLAALPLLRILVASSFMVSVYCLFIPVQNVLMRVNEVLYMNVLRFVLLMGLSYFMMLYFGLMGLGYAWVITYGLLAVVIAGMTYARTDWFRFRRRREAGEIVLQAEQPELIEAGGMAQQG